MEHNEMRRHRLPLDDATADRLSAGELHPSDAPPGYSGVARLLTEARTDLTATEIDAGLLGAMVDAVSSAPQPGKKPSMISSLISAKVATAAAALVFSTAGVAAAATGNLPAPAQDAVSGAVSHVGVDIPTSHDDHPTGNVDNPTESDSHGVDVSGTAHDTDATGADKGAEISATARDGHGPDDDTTDTTEGSSGRSADHRQDGDHRSDDAAEHGAVVTTPNQDDADDADDSDDADDADDADTSGSDHADTVPTTIDHPSGGDNPGSGHRPGSDS